MNREEALRAIKEAAAEYRQSTGDSTEDLSLAIALAELDEPCVCDTDFTCMAAEHES